MKDKAFVLTLNQTRDFVFQPFRSRPSLSGKGGFHHSVSQVTCRTNAVLSAKQQPEILPPPYGNRASLWGILQPNANLYQGNIHLNRDD